MAAALHIKFSAMKPLIALFLFLTIPASAQVDWSGDIEALKRHAATPRVRDRSATTRSRFG